MTLAKTYYKIRNIKLLTIIKVVKNWYHQSENNRKKLKY